MLGDWVIFFLALILVMGLGTFVALAASLAGRR